MVYLGLVVPYDRMKVVGVPDLLQGVLVSALPGLLALPDCGGGGVPSRQVSSMLLVPPGPLVQPGLPELVGLVPVSQVFNLDPAFLSSGLGSCLLFFLEVAGLGLSLGFVPGSASISLGGD